jgi:hypothetical protein
MNGLKKNERCPIHNSFFCCGREQVKRRTFHCGGAVERIEDATHSMGYREICSRAELRKRLLKKIEEQGGMCADPKLGGCGQPLSDFRGVELDHKEPKGMGGARRDDSLSNLQALCVECNRKKGSIRYGN